MKLLTRATIFSILFLMHTVTFASYQLIESFSPHDNNKSRTSYPLSEQWEHLISLKSSSDLQDSLTLKYQGKVEGYQKDFNESFKFGEQETSCAVGCFVFVNIFIAACVMESKLASNDEGSVFVIGLVATLLNYAALACVPAFHFYKSKKEKSYLRKRLGEDIGRDSDLQGDKQEINKLIEGILQKKTEV